MLYIKFIELVIVYYAGRMKKVENFKKVLIYQICVPAVPVNLFPVPNKFSCCFPSTCVNGKPTRRALLFTYQILQVIKELNKELEKPKSVKPRT